MSDEKDDSPNIPGLLLRASGSWTHHGQQNRSKIRSLHARTAYLFRQLPPNTDSHTHTQANSVYPNYTLCEASASLSLQGNNNIGDSASSLPPGQNAPLIHKTQKKHLSFQHPRHASKKIIPSDPKSKRKITTTDPHNPHPTSQTHTHTHTHTHTTNKQNKKNGLWQNLQRSTDTGFRNPIPPTSCCSYCSLHTSFVN
jgi:hypothetical protein